jgi:hypothetical protein
MARRHDDAGPRRGGWPIWLRATAAGVVALAAFAGYRAFDDARRRPAADDPRTAFTVEGLDCPVWCAVRLTESIDRLDGARGETFDRNHGTVVVRHDPSRQNEAALRAVFAANGFPVEAAGPAVAPR